MYAFVSENFPKLPGVYIYKNSRGEIIYIGKAKNLKKRISQYFNSSHKFSPKTQILVKNIFEVDFIVVDNEVEALLLENKLIKKHKPKYNIDLKDSKTYPYIKITEDKIPKIMSTRIVTSKGRYFGPYSDIKLKNDLINILVKEFKLLTKKTYSSKSKLNFEIGLAPAENENKIDIDKYFQNLKEAENFLKGNISQILSRLKKEMILESSKLNFEKAKEKKEMIEIIKSQKQQKVDLLKALNQSIVVIIYDKIAFSSSLIMILEIKKGVITSKKEFQFDYYENDLLKDFIKMYYSKNSIPNEILVNEVVWEDELEKKEIENYLKQFKGAKVVLTYPKKGEKLNLVNLAIKNAQINFGDKNILVELQNNLKLKSIPKIIECFDISNLGDKFVVAGMTQFVDSKPNKSNYRKFEIKSFKGQNDFLAMKEVIYRRYKRQLIEKNELPNLIIIDGGKGQLSMAVQSLKELNLSIPIVGLAKQDEEIYILGRKEPLQFDKNSKMMLFIRYIRDSTHNLVINYNRKKREMNFKKEIE